MFGVVETKAESIERAKKLSKLHAALRDAPGAIECHEGQFAALQYFIDRSNAREFDLNDRDGLHREIGDPEELLTEDDCREMREQSDLWKPFPVGWLGAGPDDKYCCQLHPKEIEYLKSLRVELEITIRAVELEITIRAIEANVPEIRHEIESLRSVALLPTNIADRYRLTEDGQPIPMSG